MSDRLDCCETWSVRLGPGTRYMPRPTKYGACYGVVWDASSKIRTAQSLGVNMDMLCCGLRMYSKAGSDLQPFAWSCIYADLQNSDWFLALRINYCIGLASSEVFIIIFHMVLLRICALWIIWCLCFYELYLSSCYALWGCSFGVEARTACSVNVTIVAFTIRNGVAHFHRSLPCHCCNIHTHCTIPAISSRGSGLESQSKPDSDTPPRLLGSVGWPHIQPLARELAISLLHDIPWQVCEWRSE